MTGRTERYRQRYIYPALIKKLQEANEKLTLKEVLIRMQRDNITLRQSEIRSALRTAVTNKAVYCRRHLYWIKSNFEQVGHEATQESNPSDEIKSTKMSTSSCKSSKSGHDTEGSAGIDTNSDLNNEAIGLGREGSHMMEVDQKKLSITFADVKGVDEAKQELKCVIEFLKNPEKFTALGAKLPRGVLLVGPPGTGKTLLARAVAGEAGVPFFSASGSEFDEVYVGQGAKRVRNLFDEAKRKAPSIIFIDELDSIGSRFSTPCQTINQILMEIDGFEQNVGSIVLGATNSKNNLLKDLVRPGRFDLIINLTIPDYVGRKEILELYLGQIVCKAIDIEKLARGTTGFTGADLENMVNQAALLAAVEGANSVYMEHIEVARAKVLMGPERKSRILDEEAKKIAAYHEGGHAIVAFYTEDSQPLHKVTIRHCGSSLGHTSCIPEKEYCQFTKSQLLAMLDVLMGGRAAEELIFGPDKITAGASSDLKHATSIATNMVKEWGMSEKVGLRTYKNIQNYNELIPGTAELIDGEINRLLNESYERAKKVLRSHQTDHKLLAENLRKYETLDAKQVESLLKGTATASTSGTA